VLNINVFHSAATVTLDHIWVMWLRQLAHTIHMAMKARNKLMEKKNPVWILTQDIGQAVAGWVPWLLQAC